MKSRFERSHHDGTTHFLSNATPRNNSAAMTQDRPRPPVKPAKIAFWIFKRSSISTDIDGISLHGLARRFPFSCGTKGPRFALLVIDDGMQ
jgi:hypothetical protein